MIEVPLAEADDSYMEALANHYRRYGDGPVSLTVTYDPASRVHTAMSATDEAARLARVLNKKGATQVVPGILPVRDQGNEPLLLLSYQSYTAHEPENCGMIAGMGGSDVEAEADYGLGCTVQSMVARQVARPKDLLGRTLDAPATDGRRSYNVVETYRKGEPNAPLEGESASGD